MSTNNEFSDYDTRIVEMVFPTQTNHYGTLFGGHALELMDKSAFITASRYARKTMDSKPIPLDANIPEYNAR